LKKKESFQKTSQQAIQVRISVDAVGFAPAGIIVIFFSAGLNGARMQTKKKKVRLKKKNPFKKQASNRPEFESRLMHSVLLRQALS